MNLLNNWNLPKKRFFPFGKCSQSFGWEPYLFLIIILLISVSCSTQIRPISTGRIHVLDDNKAFLRLEQCEILVNASHWNDPPYNIENYFSLFYVIIRNTSSQHISILPEDFVIVDQYGEQYQIFSENHVLNALYGTSQWADLPTMIPTDFTETNWKEIQDDYEERVEGVRNVTLRAFSFGDIRGRAQESGYLYFQQINTKHSPHFTLYYKDIAIPFKTLK